MGVVMGELKKTAFFAVSAITLAVLALVITPRRATPDAFFDVGETFFPEFVDPATATTLEVVEFDEDTAAAATFRVTNRNGLWTIPSHHDYPADGKERLANTAAGVIAITKDGFRSDNVTDHESFGVIDPLDESVSTLRGRGRRVTFKGTSEQVLADLIIGDRAPGPPGYNFVRVPDQNRVYAARTDINISTRFSDWIETNLLEVERDDVKRTVLNEYQIDERTGAVRRRGEFIVDWVEDYVWTANDVPAGMEVDYVQMNLLVGGIIGLEIGRGRFDYERQGNRLAAQAHVDRPAVVVEQQRQLFHQVIMEQIRPGHGRAVHPALAQRAIGRPCVGRQPIGGDFNADIRIERLRHGFGRFLAGHEPAMTLANAVAGPLIERFDMRQSLAGVFKGFELRSVAMAGAGHIDILVAKSTPSDSTFEHGRCLARFSLGWHDRHRGVL